MGPKAVRILKMGQARAGGVGGGGGGRRVASDHKVPHLARWVERFMRLRDSRPREVWQDTLVVFLEDLGDGQDKPRQGRQGGGGGGALRQDPERPSVVRKTAGAGRKTRSRRPEDRLWRGPRRRHRRVWDA